MKTKTKMLLVVGLLVALGVGFMIGILVNYPALHQNEVSGTFGKVTKFHKTQMTQKDIELRSELLKDTVNLKGLITSLTYFSVFTERVCSSIDASLISYMASGMGATADETERINGLQDYADFIRNNNNTLVSTISMITGFYLNKSADSSQDVEKTLKDFMAYVNILNEKNSVLTQALESMDKFMVNRVALKAHEGEIKQLKVVRDQLLIKGIQLGAVTGNPKAVNDLVHFALSKDEMIGEFKAIMIGSEDYIKSKGDPSKVKLLCYNGSVAKFSVLSRKDYDREASTNNSVSLIVQLGSGKADISLPVYSDNEVAYTMKRNQFKGNQKAFWLRPQWSEWPQRSEWPL